MKGDSTTDSNGNYGTKCITSSVNAPSARFENRAVCTDQNGNFWMFGGSPDGHTNALNDLWIYCVATNEWRWVSGDSILSPAAYWGIKGVSNPLNKPNG